MRIHIVLALVSSVAFASDLNDAAISEIMANEIICVRAYVEDKIYLEPERIIATEEGLFLSLSNRNYLPLPTLYSDQGGCFVHSVPSVFKRCPHCGREYMGWCTNSNCPGKANVRQHEEEKRRKKEDYKKKKEEEKSHK